jgi:hypothetical protein
VFQYNDLLRLFNNCGFPPTANYIFLGDYVDRGRQNLETILILFCYKIKFPNNFFLLRGISLHTLFNQCTLSGNHETAAVNRVYGFYEECNRRYQSPKMWQSFQDAFGCLPLSAVIADRVLCMVRTFL